MEHKIVKMTAMVSSPIPNPNLKFSGLDFVNIQWVSVCQPEGDVASQLEHSKTRVVLEVATLTTVKNFIFFACIKGLKLFKGKVLLKIYGPMRVGDNSRILAI